MKSLLFTKVQVGSTVTFIDNNNMIETGVVSEVLENKFVVRILDCWNKNGVLCYEDKFLRFFKTGTKTHSHYTHGNALAITGNI